MEKIEFEWWTRALLCELEWSETTHDSAKELKKKNMMKRTSENND